MLYVWLPIGRMKRKNKRMETAAAHNERRKSREMKRTGKRRRKKRRTKRKKKRKNKRNEKSSEHRERLQLARKRKKQPRRLS